MELVIPAEPEIVPDFPAGDIESRIRDFLADEDAMHTVLHGGEAPADGLGSTIGPQPAIDSLVVVEVLLEIEPKVPFALPESLVRAGGYDSVDEVVQHLLPQLERRWRRHYEERR